MFLGQLMLATFGSILSLYFFIFGIYLKNVLVKSTLEVCRIEADFSTKINKIERKMCLGRMWFTNGLFKLLDCGINSIFMGRIFHLVHFLGDGDVFSSNQINNIVSIFFMVIH